MYGPTDDSSLVGYVVLDATRVREMEGTPQLTIPIPLLSHIVQTVVQPGTSEDFRQAVLDSVAILSSDEPLTSLHAGNLVRRRLPDLVGDAKIREDNITLRVVETPDGWITSTGPKPQFFVFVLRDFTGALDAELASAIGVEAQRDSKFTTDACTLQTMLLRSERWAGTGDKFAQAAPAADCPTPDWNRRG